MATPGSAETEAVPRVDPVLHMQASAMPVEHTIALWHKHHTPFWPAGLSPVQLFHSPHGPFPLLPGRCSEDKLCSYSSVLENVKQAGEADHFWFSYHAYL